MFKAFIALVVVLLAISFATAQDTHAEFKACEVCTFLVSELKTVAKQYEGKVTEAIKKAVCTRFGTLEPACNAFIDEYGKAALDMLIKKIEPKVVCQKLHLCDNADWFKYYFSAEDGEHLMEQLMLEAAKKNVPESTSCDICMFVVGEAERYINESEPEIHKALLRACGYLPPQLEGVCNTMVLMYGHQLIQYLLKHGNATVVCRQIRLCPKAETAPVVFKIPEALKNEQVKPESAGCDLCQFVVGYVEEYLSKNETEEKLIKTLEKACKALPGSYAAQCIAIVDEYVPYIIYYLKEKYPPKTVCQLIGLCEKAVPVVVVVVEPKKENGMACSVCKYVISAIEAELGKNVTEEKIKKVLNKVCDQFPSVFRPQCHSFVETYTHVIIQELLKKVPPAEVCKKIGVCKDAVVEEKNDLKCSVCQYVITAVKAEIGKNETEDKIKAALNKVCDKIPGAFKTQCKAFVAEYTHIIIEMLLAKASPEEVCKAVGMCPKDALIPAIPIPQPEDGPSCALCQFVVTQVVNELGKNATEEKIKEALNKVCDKLPATFKGACKALVEEYTHVLIEQLLKKATPEQVCKAIGACPKAEVAVLPVQQEVHDQEDNSVGCSVCQFVVAQIIKEVGSNATEEKIKAALNKVCDKIPGVFKTACKSFVAEYTHVLIELLLKKATPEQVCKEIGVCPKDEVEAQIVPVVEPTPINGPICSICQFVISQIEKEIGKNATEEKIKAALNKVCDKIPGVFKTQCKAFVEQYTPIIIKELLKKANPEQVCKAIGVCTDFVAPVVEVEQEEPEEPEAKDGQFCDLCIQLATYLEEFVKKNATSPEIIKALQKACDLIPAYKEQCKVLLPMMWQQMIEKLLKKQTPKVICKQLHLCREKEIDFSDMEGTNSGMCNGCKHLVEIANNYITKNSTEEQIIKFVQKGCDYFPAAYRPMCKLVVQEYGKQIIETLVSKVLEPEKVCKVVRACPKRAQSGLEILQEHGFLINFN